MFSLLVFMLNQSLTQRSIPYAMRLLNIGGTRLKGSPRNRPGACTGIVIGLAKSIGTRYTTLRRYKYFIFVTNYRQSIATIFSFSATLRVAFRLHRTPCDKPVNALVLYVSKITITDNQPSDTCRKNFSFPKL